MYIQGWLFDFRSLQLPWARFFRRAFLYFVDWAERNGPTAAISHAKGCKLLKSIASVLRGLVWLLKAGAALTFQRTETLHPWCLSIFSSQADVFLGLPFLSELPWVRMLMILRADKDVRWETVWFAPAKVLPSNTHHQYNLRQAERLIPDA